ncbi:MAG: DMT family transporter [Actinomycetota bacterium]
MLVPHDGSWPRAPPVTAIGDSAPSASGGGVFAGAAADNDGDFAVQDWALFVGISVIWGASFLLIAESLEAMTPGVVTLGRVGFGALTLGGLRLVRHRGRRIERGDRWRVAVLAVLWVAVPFSLFPLAQQWINSAVTGLLNGATPVLVALVSVLFVRTVPRRQQLVGLVLGFGGIVLVSLGSAGEGSSQARGVLLVLGATVCYGFAINIAPPLQARYGAVVLMSTVLTVATVLVIPAALIDLGQNRWAPGPAAALLALGSVGTGLAYWIFSSLVGRVGSIRASFITYLVPVVSLVLGVWLRGDVVTGLALVGAPVTIVGAVLASRRTRGGRP